MGAGPFTQTPPHPHTHTTMRCPECNLDNEEGAAFCANCVAPLTAYGGQITGLVSDETLAKLARLRIRPPAVPIMTAFNVLVALMWPLATLLSRISSRPQVNAEGTNYAGAAFGAVGVAFLAMFMIPLGIALLVAAFGTWTQRSWGWYASAGTLGVIGAISIMGFIGGPLRFVTIAVCIVLAILWFHRDVREWYGVG